MDTYSYVEGGTDFGEALVKKLIDRVELIVILSVGFAGRRPKAALPPLLLRLCCSHYSHYYLCFKLFSADFSSTSEFILAVLSCAARSGRIGRE